MIAPLLLASWLLLRAEGKGLGVLGFDAPRRRLRQFTAGLALPVGLHLGWNLATNLIFSAGPLGATMLVAANGAARVKAEGGMGLLLKFVLPAIVLAGVSWHLRRRRQP